MRVAVARDDLLVDPDSLLGATERPQPDALVEQRAGDLRAQRRLGRGAVARDDLLVDPDSLLGATERPQPEALADQRHGDLRAQRRLGRVAVARNDLLVDPDSLLGAIQIAKYDSEVVPGERCHLVERRLPRPGQHVSRFVQASMTICSGSDLEGLRVFGTLDRAAHAARAVARPPTCRARAARCSRRLDSWRCVAAARRSRNRPNRPRKRDIEGVVCCMNTRRQIAGPKLPQGVLRDRIGSTASRPIDRREDDGCALRALGIAWCVPSSGELALECRRRDEVCARP